MIRNYRATHYPPSSNERVEHIIKHAVKSNKNWNISVDGSSPLIEAVRIGKSVFPTLRLILCHKRKRTRDTRNTGCMAE